MFFKVAGPSRADGSEGKQYTVLLPIRIGGGGLAVGVEIEPEPTWTASTNFTSAAPLTSQYH